MTSDRRSSRLESAAERTLRHLGYTYEDGAQMWRPPLGKAPDFDIIDDLRRKLAVAHARPSTWPYGQPMSSAPRNGFAFLATGSHVVDDPPGAARGVKVGDRWWAILLFDIWREPHQFVFAKDGAVPWSQPELWCRLPFLLPGRPLGWKPDLSNTRTVTDHPTAVAIYASPEFDHMNDDGKAWVAAIVEIAMEAGRDEMRAAFAERGALA